MYRLYHRLSLAFFDLSVIRTIFGRLYAMLAGVSPAEYYEIPEAEKAAPKVTV